MRRLGRRRISVSLSTIAAAERPRNVANLHQAVGAEPLPKTRQLNTQNLLSMNATAKRFSLLSRGICMPPMAAAFSFAMKALFEN
jgi:hypothetical protein